MQGSRPQLEVTLSGVDGPIEQGTWRRGFRIPTFWGIRRPRSHEVARLRQVETANLDSASRPRARLYSLIALPWRDAARG